MRILYLEIESPILNVLDDYKHFVYILHKNIMCTFIAYTVINNIVPNAYFSLFRSLIIHQGKRNQLMRLKHGCHLFLHMIERTNNFSNVIYEQIQMENYSTPMSRENTIKILLNFV